MKNDKKLNPIFNYLDAEGYDVSKTIYGNSLYVVIDAEKTAEIKAHNDSFEITLYEKNTPVSTDFVEGLNEIVDQLYWWEKE